MAVSGLHRLSALVAAVVLLPLALATACSPDEATADADATARTADATARTADGVEAEEPLYERLGGLPAISLVVSDFVDDFVQDPVIMANDAVRERKTPEAAPYIKYQVTSLVCEASGGPCQYTGMDMRSAHEGLNVTEEEWNRMVEIFAGTLEQHNVPERETQELFALLGPSKDDIVVAGTD